MCQTVTFLNEDNDVMSTIFPVIAPVCTFNKVSLHKTCVSLLACFMPKLTDLSIVSILKLTFIPWREDQPMSDCRWCSRGQTKIRNTSLYLCSSVMFINIEKVFIFQSCVAIALSNITRFLNMHIDGEVPRPNI